MTDINKVNDEALENVTGGARRIVSGSPVGYAHVRTGPGKGYEVAYDVDNGCAVYTTGRHTWNGDYNWYELTNGCWIAGSLIGYSRLTGFKTGQN